MYKTKPSKYTELRMLTNPKRNGVVNMYQKDQTVCSISRLEDLESIEAHLDAIFMVFNRAAKVNQRINDIINDKDDTLFLGLDRLQDIAFSKIQQIKDLPGHCQVTRFEFSNAYDEMQQPENQSPFAAGRPSLSDVMEDI